MMFMSVVLIILICVGITYLISNYNRERLQFLKAANALLGPKPQPIIGNAYYFLQKNFDEFLSIICSLTDTYPSPFRFWLGNKLLIFINEPDQIKTILQSPSCLNKGIIYEPMKAFLGTGLLTAPAHIWTQNRKIIASNFNTNILRGLCDIFMEHTLVFMEKLEHIVNDEVDLSQHLIRLTLDSIYDTVCNAKLSSQLKKTEPYANAIKRSKEIVTHRMRNIFLFPDILFNLTPLSREQRKHLNIIHSDAEKFIQKQDTTDKDGNENQFAKASRRAFFNILMEASNENKNFTRKELINEMKTIIATGTDTTAITLNFIMFMLANFPEVQQKVYEELLEIYGTQDPKSAPVKFKDLQNMNYLDCVIKETLRLFPAAPIIGRRLGENLQIDEYVSGKYTLPKGADILLTIITLHRNEKYWPEALTFNPDRFLPENAANIYPNSYIPFSSGPRNCIGIKYGMTSMKVIIATLLRTYILKVDKRIKIEEIKLKLDFMLASVNTLKVRIQKRK